MNSPMPPTSDSPAAPATPGDPASTDSPVRVAVPGGRGLAAFFGVILPVVALAVELSTGMCQGFLDPAPTVGHALAIALVPLAHLIALLVLGRGQRRPSLRLAAWLNSAALAIGLLYTALFAPITPFAFIAIIFFGLGFLPLAPLASVIAALCLRRALRRHAAAHGLRLPSIWPGLLAGLLLLAALEGPPALTTYGVRRLAEAETPRARASALRLLRGTRPLGGEEQLLRGAYERFPTGFRQEALKVFTGEAPSASDYQLAYYRVTGRPYNHAPAPRPAGFGGGARSDTRDWSGDTELGTQQVGGRLRSLQLTESRIDGQVEADAALGYLEWTLVFRNEHAFDQREARAVVQLPPGAAVSRLTLWVHGEEREAAWGGPGKVIEAYRSVAVVQRRDPVLVTAHGPDRVLMQCFPIEPRGGLMKIRLGITLPLAFADQDRAHLLLPRFIEQNFTTPATLSHEVWIESARPLASGQPTLVPAASVDQRHALRGSLAADDFASGLGVASVTRPPDLPAAWSPALRDPSRIITQTLHHQPAPAGPVALVLSGSAELAAAAAALADQLADAGSTPFTTLYLAGDELATSPPGLDAPAQAAWLRARVFTGGQDDTPALAEALDALAARGGGTLVWLHGGQPLTWQNPSALEQRLARRAGLVRVLSVPVVAAPNLLLEKIGATTTPLNTFPRLSTLPADLARLMRELREGRLIAERTAHPAEAFRPIGTRVSEHLSRLWARDEVHRLLAASDLDARDAAQRLALATQIVTPVSGAVVLETQAQYQANGLEPSDARNSPNVPEPATYGLIMAGALLLFTALRRRGFRRFRSARSRD